LSRAASRAAAALVTLGGVALAFRALQMGEGGAGGGAGRFEAMERVTDLVAGAGGLAGRWAGMPDALAWAVLAAVSLAAVAGAAAPGRWRPHPPSDTLRGTEDVP
jgi:hypothetical protein